MSYLRAEEILPQELIEEIQRYVNGTCIYIPVVKKQDWGSATQTRQLLQNRNEAIYRDFCQGISVKLLAQNYYLSVKSIQRILRAMRKSHG